MREFCLTEEVTQRFIDGELSPEQTEGAAAHVAACERCASLLSEVEQESSLLMKAFAPEMSLTVPTVRLRERLDAAIADLQPRRAVAGESSSSGLRAWFGSLFGSISFRPQQAFGFASLAIVIVFAAIFAVIQLRNNKEAAPTVAGNRTEQAKAQQPVAQQPVAEQPVAPPASQIIANDGEEPAEAKPPTPVRTNTGISPAPRRVSIKRPDKATGNSQPEVVQPPAPVAPRLLPGERSYLEAIASLTTAIEANKDDALKPTVRADYERNLAVVDQAIATTRQQAKRNPNDRYAAEFMYTAYQNKIELLSAVADQTRLASR